MNNIFYVHVNLFILFIYYYYYSNYYLLFIYYNISKQRTATYLSPLDPRYAALQALNPSISSLPIDVRTYFLTFNKLI